MNHLHYRRFTALGRRAHQRGAVAIVVGLSIAVLMGFIGLALDGGHLYLTKTELQNSADACALAASYELTGSPNIPTTAFARAEAAGRAIGKKNKVDFQGLAIADININVSFNSVLSGGVWINPGSSSSKYVRCTLTRSGITPWFMQVLNFGTQTVSALATASLEHSQTFCSSLPMGVCAKPGEVAPNYGYSVGEWIASNFTSNGQDNGNGNDEGDGDDGVTGNFRWVDFTPNAGGNSEIRDQLAGQGQVCGLAIGDDIRQPGTQQGAKAAYNTRFGFYPNGANGYTPQTAPPDRTGYAYPNKTPGSPVIPVGTSAYADYKTRQGSHTPFIKNEYGVQGPGGNISGNPTADQTFAADRRLVPVPVIDCNAGNTVPMIDMACVLMLNPMSNGATGTIYLEYRGNASSASTSECQTYGGGAGPGSTGPMVPVLVQ
jgi:hypothetical protein